MTSADLTAFGETYIRPLYQIAGGIAAVAVIVLAVYFVIYPFIRRA